LSTPFTKIIGRSAQPVHILSADSTTPLPEVAAVFEVFVRYARGIEQLCGLFSAPD
jgi:hypothetical protein